MTTLNLDINKRYSYADYLTWMDDKRCELYDGYIVELTTPLRKHQEVSGNFIGIIGNYIRGKTIKAYHAPFDVRFPTSQNSLKDEQIFTVLQPDLCIICDPTKLDDRGCLGAPDFIIEITSPETSSSDIKYKYKIYEQHGVLEYWIVSPVDETVTVFVLDENGKYQFNGMFAGDNKIPVHILNGELEIDLAEVFV